MDDVGVRLLLAFMNEDIKIFAAKALLRSLAKVDYAPSRYHYLLYRPHLQTVDSDAYPFLA
jgi:hypothetical protein